MHDGSGIEARSSMKASNTLPSWLTVMFRFCMLLNAPCGSSRMAGVMTDWVRFSLKALAATMQAFAIFDLVRGAAVDAVAREVCRRRLELSGEVLPEEAGRLLADAEAAELRGARRRLVQAEQRLVVGVVESGVLGDGEDGP